MNINESTGNQAVLITGGRAPAALELARQLSALGHTVYAADSLANPLIRFSNCISRFYKLPSPRENEQAFVARIKEIVQAHHIELLVPTCEEIYYISQIKNSIAGCKVFTDDPEKLIMLHNKWAFIGLVGAAGLHAPETILLQSQNDLELLHNASSDAKWVLKPVYSRFASYTRVYEARELPPALFLSKEYPWVAQQFVKGREYCTYAIAQQGKVYAYTDYEVDFTAGMGASIYFKPCGHPELLKWVQAFVHHIGFTGQIAFDFIIDEGGEINPLECNPRATSGLHLFCEKDKIDQALWDADAGMIIPSEAKPKMISSAMLYYGIKQRKSLRGFGHWLVSMASGKDVIFQWKDPKPFLAQGYVMFDLWRKARKARKTIKAFSTHDIEWNG
ncbi:putative ATP-grasp superfamily ATP-dependent carboligase [Paenibacillus castaneae]|uniref:ATP-grasp domain-containing protein n=1 Tax=Paenibacillus castaneae TaxID=474957 RepID=UPI001FBC09CB|nr:ATP-grasp domain-containing protein [Paenibacillus castaneae]NIK75182.1 putative ATP-grasp superfamily ATP-dependent carboligase [Paenibacillus castaneae]